MKQLVFILELIWLGLAIFCIGLGAWVMVKAGLNSGYIFFVMAAVAFLMYMLRRSRRKKMQKQEQ